MVTICSGNEVTMSAMYVCVLFWNLPMNSQKKFQPSKSTIVEVTAGLAKTTIETTKETTRITRITMKGGIILESSHELPKKISAI